MSDGIQPTMEDDPPSPTGGVDANSSSNNNDNNNNNINNNKATNQTEPSFCSLPPPNISGEEIDRLLTALTTPTDGSSTGANASPPPRSSPPRLAGREVLIPAFETGVAFFEGELRPERRRRQQQQQQEQPQPNGTTARHKHRETGGENDEEWVCISTAPKTENRRKSEPLPKEGEGDGNVVSASLSDALEWLRKHSSSAEPRDGSTARKGTPERNESSSSSSSSSPGPTPKPAVAVAAAAAVGEPEPDPNSKPPTAKPTARAGAKNTATETERGGRRNDEPPSIMFNINEEYDAEGNRVFAEAVDLSSRLSAVYGDAAPGRSNARSSEETSRGVSGRDDSGPSADGDGEGTEPETKTKAVVSDEEYDRISRRLEELARMEEEESKREKEMRSSSPKALGSTTKKKKTTASSSFGFKKGFLNAPQKSGAKKKSPPKVSKSKATNATATPTETPTATPVPSEPPLDAAPKKPSGGGVTINTDNNEIHEIPREGRQQPLPKRIARQPQPQPQPGVDSAHNATVSPTRLLDSSVFSGQISERSAAPSPTTTAAAAAISSDTAARLAANEQTRSLQNELAQQERQRSSKPKRVSRFKQQRQQEQVEQQQQQQQQPKRVSRFKQQRRQQEQ